MGVAVVVFFFKHSIYGWQRVRANEGRVLRFRMLPRRLPSVVLLVPQGQHDRVRLQVMRDRRRRAFAASVDCFDRGSVSPLSSLLMVLHRGWHAVSILIIGTVVECVPPDFFDGLHGAERERPWGTT